MAPVGRILLLVALVAAPWVFGCVQPWPQFYLAAAIAGLSLLRAIEAIVSRPVRNVHLPLAALAPLALLVIAAVQLRPGETALPAKMQHAVYSDDAPLFDTDDAATASGTLAPSSTRREAARLTLALAAFLLAAQWFADPDTHRPLLGVLALNGVALGGFGIIQALSWNGMLFWSVPMRYGGTPFASYVNRNNAAGYLNLCMAAAIGLAILVWSRSPGIGHRLERWKDRLRLAIAQLDGAKTAIIVLLIATVASLLFALSRGGIVALGIGGIGVILTAFRGSSRWGLALLSLLIVLGAVGLLIYSGQFETVDERMETLSDPLQAATGRLQHWSDTLGAVRDFPILGTGLGTYRFANQPYQQNPSHAWYYNADNEWFEILVETGSVGLAVALLGFILVGVCSLFLLRRGDPPARAIGACGLFVVLSQGVQAVTDFGLLIPANGITFAVLAGTVCGAACRAAEFDRLRIPVTLSLMKFEGRIGQGLLAIVLALASGAFLLELYVATVAESARNHGVEVIPDETRRAAVDAAISQMEDALEIRPDDGELHQVLGLLYADRARMEIYRTLLEEFPEADERQRRSFWQFASIPRIGIRARQLAAAGQTDELSQLRSLPAVTEYLTRARSHFDLSLRHTPLARGAALWLSRLAFLSSDIKSSQNLGNMRKARFTAPASPGTLFELAGMAEITGEGTFAEECWRGGLPFDPLQGPAVWKTAIARRSPEKTLESVIPEQVDVLVEIAETLEDEDDKQMVARRAQEVLEADSSPVSHHNRARLAELQSQPDVAIRQYRLALSDDPWDSIVRLKLARLLDRQGRLSEAVAEYSLLRQRLPNRKDIQSEYADLRKRERASRGR